jgi:hypothetical protein
MPNNIPLVPLVMPQPGQQHYFLLKGIPIWISHATMVPTSCMLRHSLWLTAASESPSAVWMHVHIMPGSYHFSGSCYFR